jgi:predicted DsbA family dithiol-disulfide isomerase
MKGYFRFMTAEATTAPARLNVHVDPLCPLAWRTALWLREARKVRPIEITWKIFSLEIVNRKEGTEPDYVNGAGWAALRSLALARRRNGNEGFEKLYVALGNAAHGRKESIRDHRVVAACTQEAGFGENFVNEALADESTIQDVINDHQEAVKRYYAFGVPTIAFQGSEIGFYGPIIHTVPHGEEAGEFWDHVSWELRNPNLFELKRDRAQAQWGPVAAD